MCPKCEPWHNQRVLMQPRSPGTTNLRQKSPSPKKEPKHQIGALASKKSPGNKKEHWRQLRDPAAKEKQWQSIDGIKWEPAATQAQQQTSSGSKPAPGGTTCNIFYFDWINWDLELTC